MKKYIQSILDGYFNLVKRYLPEDRARSVVGLDIGAHACKMIEVSQRSEGYQILSWGIEPIEGGDVRKAMTTVLSKVVIPTVSPVTALFGKGTLVRFIEMPRMGLEELKNSFVLEADKYFPFPQDQIYLDCHIITERPSDNKTDVLAAAAKKELVDKRIDLLTSVNLQADFIGLNAVALANIMQISRSPATNPASAKPSSAIAVLDLGEAVSNLTIFKDTVPWFTRDIFIGGSDLTKAITHGQEIAFAEAEDLKLHPGPKEKDILNSMESVMMNLISELRLSFDYFVTEHNASISEILLTGGASRTVQLAGTLQKHLETPVKPWDIFNGIIFAENLKKDELLKEVSAMGVALGLALGTV